MDDFSDKGSRFQHFVIRQRKKREAEMRRAIRLSLQKRGREMRHKHSALLQQEFSANLGTLYIMIKLFLFLFFYSFWYKNEQSTLLFMVIILQPLLNNVLLMRVKCVIFLLIEFCHVSSSLSSSSSFLLMSRIKINCPHNVLISINVFLLIFLLILVFSASLLSSAVAITALRHIGAGSPHNFRCRGRSVVFMLLRGLWLKNLHRGPQIRLLIKY